MTGPAMSRSDLAEVLQNLAQQWRRSSEETEYPQLKQCYAERAREVEARARAIGKEEGHA